MAKAQPRRATTDLPEFEPLICRIDTSNAVHDDKFDEDRVKLTMTVVQGDWAHKDPPAKISCQHTLTVESRGDGTPSLYAQIVHGVHPADLSKQELYDYDSDGLKGHVVAVVGQIKESEKGRFWNPIAYRRPAQVAPVAAGQPAAAPPQSAPNGAPQQVSADGQWGWDGANWRPIASFAPPPAPATPPPPPSAPPAPMSPSAPAASAPAAGSAPAPAVRF